MLTFKRFAEVADAKLYSLSLGDSLA